MTRSCQVSFSKVRLVLRNPASELLPSIALYGHTLALSGDTAGARKALADLQHMTESRYVSSLYFAAIHLGLGENSVALDELDQAYKERNDRLLYLGLEPMADALRSEPRFTQLLHKIGIQ